MSILQFFCINLHAVDFGTKEEAENMLERAVNIIKLDKSMALELFAEGEGGFNYKDLYRFVITYHWHDVQSSYFYRIKQRKKCSRRS